MEEKTNSEEQGKLKLQFITSDELWDKVLKYKINSGLKNNNRAVEELINKALEGKGDIEIFSEDSVPEDTLEEIGDFRHTIPTFEKKHGQPFLIFLDKKSGTYYTECHLLGSEFIKFSDPNSTIDPELEELSKANRELETDNYYYEQMVNDAKEGRSFSDIIIEYNTSYNEAKPLKIIGGQHRNQAIIEAVKEKINIVHGIKVYFNLSKEQREDIMRIANTNINVATDLRDRLREDVLVPILKKFGYETGMLKQGEKSWTFNFKMQKEMKNFMITANGSSYKETKHPTEKPLSLIKYLIEIHSNKDDLILDCFMGSGTVALASKQLERNFIGIESQKEYVDMANVRLQQGVLK